jgi:hypothetical protein
MHCSLHEVVKATIFSLCFAGEDIVFLATDISLPGAVDWVMMQVRRNRKFRQFFLTASFHSFFLIAVLLRSPLHADFRKTGKS